MDIIQIEGLETDAVIGVHAWERTVRQPLLFDVTVEFDNRAPAASDDLARSVDYAEICNEVRSFAQNSGVELLETLVERLVEHLLLHFGNARAFVLTVRKPAAARALGVASLGVRIRRERLPG